MFNGLKVFHHRSDAGDESPAENPSSEHSAPGFPIPHPIHGWPRHPLEERRSKKRDESFRGLIELEAELEHEVDGQD